AIQVVGQPLSVVERKRERQGVVAADLGEYESNKHQCHLTCCECDKHKRAGGFWQGGFFILLWSIHS
ncbi:MAG TPA: hypothetical protein VE713_04060, partial [Pyrinomonadaceae bacterium]|nr:hypothetical protein [Pyrinomonadaceae bacterium]